ncbi:MAG: hypothetical protein M0P73_14780 [Syntrophobacterales bacterium]|jgi:hypothetical protein|nr:hypothetical protein [Syntrophobacterales bacterium]
MAIKNLETHGLPEWGKIKIGYKGEENISGQGKKFGQPTKLDCFLITTVQRDAAGRLMADRALMNKFAKEEGLTIPEGPYKGLPVLKEIPIRLLYDDIDLNFFTRYASYRGSRCWCSGDGEIAQRQSGNNGNYEEVKCPCERLDALYDPKKGDKCKPMGTLQALIQGTDRIGGVWKLRSTGWNTVPSILKSLGFIKTLTGGPLAGIPLWMVLSPKTVDAPGFGRTVVYVVSLEYRAMDPNKRPKFIGLDEEGDRLYISAAEQELTEWGFHIAQRRIKNQINMVKIEADHKKLLIAPHNETIEEQAETGKEFYPDGFLDNAGPEPGTTEGAALNRTEMPPDPDPLNLDGGEAVPEQVFTIPRETKHTEETVPPGYEGPTETHRQTNDSKNGGRNRGNSLF